MAIEVKLKKRKPSIKQKKALDILVGNGGNITQAMLDAGYSPATANTPQKLTESKAWQELMAEYLPDHEIAEKHKQLLNSTVVDHMVFPLGPKGEDDVNFSGGTPNKENKSEGFVERTSLTDQEIKEMLAEVGCKVRRIVHGETARHVYFWTADSKSRKDAIDMAYKLKGSYAPEKSLVATVKLNESKKAKTDEIISRLANN